MLQKETVTPMDQADFCWLLILGTEEIKMIRAYEARYGVELRAVITFEAPEAPSSLHASEAPLSGEARSFKS